MIMKLCSYCLITKGMSSVVKCINGKDDDYDLQQPLEGDYHLMPIFQYLCPDCGSIYYGLKPQNS